ncbi:Receptor expression-enhancing protein [Lachnellula suecica]|uniref:Protein YOP1 n=1 Tax=Lachnellula suecica TaxID=602035 RepID=A0A8T9BW18_9HELO|nr:Receptor expression-enhancing protein [Lachnellula suecica]
MFDTFARLLSSIPTFLFPVFASYKALKTSDPALLTPWLMYWVVLACALLAESWVGFILYWCVYCVDSDIHGASADKFCFRIPFYSWMRLGFLLYLILPQTQGAKVLYQKYVHPFLHENELAIDDFISSAHDRAKAAGVEYLKHAFELIKQYAFGIPPNEQSAATAPTTLSYTQSLMARFNIPSARPAFPAVSTSTATDFYSLLASAVTAATARDPATDTPNQARDLSNSGTLIPPTVHGEDRLSFISAQRERLAILLSALDKEATTLQSGTPTPRASALRQVPSMFFDGSGSSEEEAADRPKSAMSGLSSRKSEGDFEKIDAESGTEEVENSKRRQTSGGSWLPWSWGAQNAVPADTLMSDAPKDSGKSSGVDA